MTIRKLLLGTAAVATILSGTAANALTFNLLPAAGAAGAGVAQGTAARRGFETAAAYWSSVFTDNITMNLTIGYSTLGTGILGSTGSARTLLSMNQYYAAAAADAKSSLDSRAVANLPTLGASAISTASGAPGAVTALANGFANGVTATNGYTSTSSRIDNDAGVNNSTLSITKASAKALGITTDVNNAAVNYATSDASITFSDAFLFDFDPTNGIDINAFDFIGVAIHEIGHALGFVSGVDSYDSRTSPGQTAATSLTSTEGFVTLSQLDLFRYSADSTALGMVDWRTGGTSYFSLDKGATQLFGDSRFSTGVLNGDGRQASHFKDSPAGAPQLGVMDPTSGRGQLQEVTALDLAAFDVIGWDVNVDVLANPGYRVTTVAAYNAWLATVPEPSSWALMIIGFGGIGAAMRRRKTLVSFA